MLKTSERVRPWSARCSPRSVGRLTTRRPSSRSKLRSRETAWRSWPLGPFTVTSPGPTCTSTLAGISIGSFPIRLIAPHSPDVGDDLAADALAPRLVRGHDAGRGGDDHGAHAALHLRQFPGGRVLAATGLGDPAKPADHGVAVLGVLELHADRLE